MLSSPGLQLVIFFATDTHERTRTERRKRFCLCGSVSVRGQGWIMDRHSLVSELMRNKYAHIIGVPFRVRAEQCKLLKLPNP